MKKCLLLLASSLSLVACDKNNRETDVVPAVISSAFNQDFTLAYRQQALLPVASQPELTVDVTDLSYAFCPKDARCFVADFVWPTLTITDAQGQTQQLKLPANQQSVYTAAWLDTTSVRANGRRYLLSYLNWRVKPTCENPQKKDITVSFRISKAGEN